MPRKIFKKSRHIRWNWEKSPDNEELVRYHLIIVDDRDREGIMNKFLDQIQKVSSGIEVIREELEGKVANSKLRYLFASYDTVVAPREIDFSKLGNPIKRDRDLRERVRRNIKDYVADEYER